MDAVPLPSQQAKAASPSSALVPSPPPPSLDLADFTASLSNTLPLHLLSCRQVHAALKAFTAFQADSLSRETLLSLKCGGLISLLPPADFPSPARRAAERTNLDEELRATCDTRDKLDQEIKDLSGRTRAGRIFRSIVGLVFSNSADRLTALRRESNELSRRIQALSDQGLSLDQREKVLSRYSDTTLGPVSLTKRGAYFLKQLDERLCEVADWSFLSFQRQTLAARRVLAVSLRRLNEIYHALQQKENVRRDDRVMDFCLALGLSPFSPAEIGARSAGYLSRIRPFGCGSLGILPALKKMVSLPGGPETHWDDLRQVWGRINGSFRNSYAAWEVAARILHIPGETLDDRMTRYTKICAELERNGWKFSDDTRRLAAVIAASPVDPAECVSRFIALKAIIKKAGGRDLYAAELAAAKLTREGFATNGLSERVESIVKELAPIGVASHPGQVSLAVELAGVPDLAPSSFALLRACIDIVARHGMSEQSAARDGVKLFKLAHKTDPKLFPSPAHPA